MNIKVFSLLNIPLDEIPKAKSPQPRLKVEEAQSSMFDLTGGDQLDEKIDLDLKKSGDKR
jgi:hypothetical protein